ncbi:MAG: histidine phosphatase family protein [Desulfonatronovibrionaceae bacterium]
MQHTLLLLRHGLTSNKQPWRYTGQRQVFLQNTGRSQAAEWIPLLQELPLETVWTSPLHRCLETAVMLGSLMKKPVFSDSALQEISLGTWEGLTRKQVQLLYPGEYEKRGNNFADYRPFQGESFADLCRRVLPFVQVRLARPGLSLAVTHAGVIRVICCQASGRPLQNLFDFHPGFGSLTILSSKQNKPALEAVGLLPDDPDTSRILNNIRSDFA